MANQAVIKLSKFPLNPCVENLLSVAEFDTLSPWEKGFANYMQGDWPESPLKDKCPFESGTKEYQQYCRGQHAAMITAQDSEE